MTNCEFNFTGKVAIVTGGAGAIGRELVKAYVDAGAKVAAIDIMSPAGLDESPYKEHVAYFRTDITKAEQVKETVRKIIEWGGRIDFLINTAGVVRRGSFISASEADFDLTIDVNLKGMYLMSQAVSPVFIEQRQGKIVNFASTGGVVGFATTPAYCASKGGVIMLTKSNAVELAPYGINVNAVSPNAVDQTSMMAEALAIPGEKERRIAKVPLGRMVMSNDLIGPVLFLCSEASSMITGHNLVVDGGFLA